jgi:hypothetical protein
MNNVSLEVEAAKFRPFFKPSNPHYTPLKIHFGKGFQKACELSYIFDASKENQFIFKISFYENR